MVAPSTVTIGGDDYYFWTTGKKDSAYLILFGGTIQALFGSYPSYEDGNYFLTINDLYSKEEYTPEKEAFVSKLSLTHDVLSPAGQKQMGPYPEWRYPPYAHAPIGSDFITQIGYWMWKQGYLLRNLFGFSAGAAAIAHLVTITGEDWTNAVIASAPVNWDDFPGGREIVLTQTAHYSKLAKTNMYFIMPEQDFTGKQMNDYFQTRLGGLYGNVGFNWPNGHDVFPYTGSGLPTLTVAKIASNVSRFPPIGEPVHHPKYRLWGLYTFSGFAPDIDFTTKRQILGYFNQYFGGSILGDRITVDTGYQSIESYPIWIEPMINLSIGGAVNGYKFVGWNFGSLPAGAQISGNSFFYYPDSEAYFDVNCILQPPTPTTTINLNAIADLAGATGSVSPSGLLTLNVGQSYQFAAIPNTGYMFDHWDMNGTNQGSSNPLPLTITSEMNGTTLTAIFAVQPAIAFRASSWQEWLSYRPSNFWTRTLLRPKV